jgi:hypothetical protein
MDWTPFEDRPRPPELGKVVLALDRMRRIEIISDDEAAIGTIFAWLLGQAQLARRGKTDRSAVRSAPRPRRD